MFFFLILDSCNTSLIIPEPKQKTKEKTEVDSPNNLFFVLTCANIFVPLKAAKKNS